MNNVIFSRKSDELETPKDIFEQLNNEFQFNLDPCASESNHKTPWYYTQKEDGLLQNWGGVQSVL